MLINATIANVSKIFTIVEYNNISNNTDPFDDELSFSFTAIQFLLQHGKDDDSYVNASYKGIWNFVPVTALSGGLG